MSKIFRRGRRLAPAAVAGAIGMGGALSAAAAAAPATAQANDASASPTREQLLERIRSLRGRVEQMQSADAQAATRPAADAAIVNAADADAATVDSVLSDALSRSQLLQTSGGLPFVTGRRGGGFVIQDEAGDFVIRPNFQFQFRHVANFRSDDTTGFPDDDETVDTDDGTGDEVTEEGFEVRRLKLAVDGNAFGPDLTYRFQWEMNRAHGGLVLEDAWVRYGLGGAFGRGARDFAVRAGQFKDPTFHEEVTTSRRQLAADRSMVNEVLGGGVTDRVQGVALIWNDGPEGSPFRAEGGFTDGFNTDNNSFRNDGGSAFFDVEDPSWGAFARVEYLAAGGWRQYEDFTALGNRQDLLVIGAGASYTETRETLLYTADVQYENDRLGLYAAYYGAYSEQAGADDDDEGNEPQVDFARAMHDMGLLVQAGYLVADRCELFARYDQMLLDDERFAGDAGGEDTFPELTVGLNWYFKGHAAKFTIDGTWLPNGAPANLDGIGILDPDGDNDQFILRTQFQLLI